MKRRKIKIRNLLNSLRQKSCTFVLGLVIGIILALVLHFCKDDCINRGTATKHNEGSYYHDHYRWLRQLNLESVDIDPDIGRYNNSFKGL